MSTSVDGKISCQICQVVDVPKAETVKDRIIACNSVMETKIPRWVWAIILLIKIQLSEHVQSSSRFTVKLTCYNHVKQILDLIRNFHRSDLFQVLGLDMGDVTCISILKGLWGSIDHEMFLESKFLNYFTTLPLPFRPMMTLCATTVALHLFQLFLIASIDIMLYTPLTIQ